MEATIRRAVADDSEFLAWAMLAASRSHGDRGTFDLIANKSEQDRLDVAGWLTLNEIPNYCHYQHYLVSERDGRLVTAAQTMGQPDWNHHPSSPVELPRSV